MCMIQYFVEKESILSYIGFPMVEENQLKVHCHIPLPENELSWLLHTLLKQ